MKKLSFSLVASCLVTSFAMAEANGAFVGLEFGYSGASIKAEENVAYQAFDSNYNSASNYCQAPANDTTNGYWTSGLCMFGGSKTISAKPTALRYGVVAGYKYFINDEWGFRTYVNLATGTKYTTGDKGSNFSSTQVYNYNLGLNIDALYNFAKVSDMELGAFAGVNVGYAHHDFKNKAWGDKQVDGIDAGFNLGLRANYEQHGIELFTKFSLSEQSSLVYSHTQTTPTTSNNGIQGIEITEGRYIFSQPYTIGLRYIYSF